MKKHKPDPTWEPKPAPGPRYLCESEVVTGLKDYAAAELRSRYEDRVKPLESARAEELPFHFDGALESLAALRLTLAVYLVRHYPIPRPQALLGHQHLTELLRQVNTVRSLHPAGSFSTFRISAAGSRSSVFQRIKEAVQASTGLLPTDDEADLVLRVRPAALHPDGWEVLARLSPRPLSARTWRVCDMLGALNGVIAAAMVEMTQPLPADRVLNLMCGSGTLLIERLLRGPAAAAGGCDTDSEALRCAEANLRTAGLFDKADLFVMDATRLQMPDACMDVIVADLPWGQLVGNHEVNQRLYPAVLREAARVAAPGARAVFITHEIRLMEQVLDTCADIWAVTETARVFQGGLHPRIYRLTRV
jgi:23S rRNA G2445 N2-methylase RlmL